MIDCANELLISLVNHFEQLYGKTEIAYNVHQLTHRAVEDKVFIPLDNIAGFPYENYLGHLNSLLGKPHLPMHQIVKTETRTARSTCTVTVMVQWCLTLAMGIGTIRLSLKNSP